MQNTFDTLQIVGGDEKQFSDWGFSIEGLTGLVRNQAVDSWQATIVNSTVAKEADSPAFAFGQQIIIRINRTSSNLPDPLTGIITPAKNSFSGGTSDFVGKRIDSPMKAGAGGQGVTYKFYGPWYDLDNSDFQQNFAGTAYQSLIAETILFTGFDQFQNLMNISVGDQLQAGLQFLIDTYAGQGMPLPFQYTGRALTAGKIDLTTTATAPATPDATNQTFNFLSLGLLSANPNFYYQNLVPAKPTIDRQLFGSYFPSFIEKPMKCSEVLKKCLELWPRTNIWFDYTTLAADGKTPLPTIHIDVVDNMSPVTLALFDGVSHKDVNINRRDDLLVRAVVITYRITAKVNGLQLVSYVFDQWGPHGSNSWYAVYNAAFSSWIAGHANDFAGAGLAGNQAAAAAVLAGTADPISGYGVVSELVELSGGALTTVEGHLDVEPIWAVGGTQATKRSWWASKRGGEVSKLEDLRVRFQDNNGNQTTIPDATVVDALTGALVSLATYPNRIVRGTHHAWMQLPGGVPVISKKVKLIAKMQFCEYNTVGASDTDLSPKKIGTHNGNDQHVNMEVTNGTTGSYSTIASVTVGEAYIIGIGGIAQYLWQHMNVPQYDGDFVKVAANFEDSTSASYVHPGRSLNLSGASVLWNTMNAQIQEIEKDYGRHETRIRVGVAKHLNTGQLSALLNMWRFRRPWYNPQLRSNNQIASGGTVDQAITAGNANTVAGLEDKSQLALNAYTNPTDPTSGVVASLNLDMNGLVSARSL